MRGAGAGPCPAGLMHTGHLSIRAKEQTYCAADYGGHNTVRIHGQSSCRRRSSPHAYSAAPQQSKLGGSENSQGAAVRQHGIEFLTSFSEPNPSTPPGGERRSQRLQLSQGLRGITVALTSVQHRLRLIPGRFHRSQNVASSSVGDVQETL